MLLVNTGVLPSTRAQARVLIATVLLALAVLVLQGCDGDDEPEASGDDSAIVETSTPTESEEEWPPPTATPDPEQAVDEADVDALAAEAGCDITSPQSVSEPWLHEVAPQWVTVGDRLVAPNAPTDGHWYAGHTTITWHSEEPPTDEVVSGANLETGDDVPETAPTINYEVPDGVMKAAWVEIPESGCWEFAIGNQSFVAYVLPEDENPDVIERTEEREAMKPFDAPDDCDRTGWVGPTARPGTPMGYWIDSPELGVFEVHGLLYADESQLFIVSGDNNLEVEGQSVSNPTLTARSETQLASGGQVSLSRADITFPVAGCWDLTFTAEGQSMDVAVYVYPEECRRQEGEELSTDCVIPD